MHMHMHMQHAYPRATPTGAAVTLRQAEGSGGLAARLKRQLLPATTALHRSTRLPHGFPEGPGRAPSLHPGSAALERLAAVREASGGAAPPRLGVRPREKGAPLDTNRRQGRAPSSARASARCCRGSSGGSGRSRCARRPQGWRHSRGTRARSLLSGTPSLRARGSVRATRSSPSNIDFHRSDVFACM